MARLPRVTPAGVPVHHIIRGNNRGDVFRDDRDRTFLRELLIDGCRRFECQVHAYVFMTNHTHLLLTPAGPDSISRLTQWVGSRYVVAFNRRHDRTGTLWEGRFRSSIVSTRRYFLACSRYIDQNPVRAGMVRSPDAYLWSSYARLAHGAGDLLVEEHDEYRALGSTPTERQRNYAALCAPPLDVSMVQGIRRAARAGRAIEPAVFQQRRRRVSRPGLVGGGARGL